MSAPPTAIRNAWNDSGPVAVPENVFAVELARESLPNGLLSVGDKILSVNGQAATRLSHEALGQ
eukprot:gene10767-2332_t